MNTIKNLKISKDRIITKTEWKFVILKINEVQTTLISKQFIHRDNKDENMVNVGVVLEWDYSVRQENSDIKISGADLLQLLKLTEV